MTGPVGAFTGEVRGVPDLESVRGPGAKLAFVQLLLADKCRSKSVELMDQLEAEKQDAVKAKQLVEKFIAQKAAAAAQGGFAVLSAEDAQWCKDRGISFPGDNLPDQVVLGTEDWQVLIDNTKAFADNPPDNSQTLMVLIQDQLGQYNSFTQGASANIGNANTITQGLARW